MTESRATVYNRRAVESPSIRDDSDVSILQSAGARARSFTPLQIPLHFVEVHGYMFMRLPTNLIGFVTLTRGPQDLEN